MTILKKIISGSMKILAGLLIVFLLSALFVNLSTIWSVRTIKQGGQVSSGLACVLISSGSMEPVISVNDLLILKGFEEYRPDDIITYVSDRGSLITHRVTERSGQSYITQGDANNVPDSKISGQQILGKTVFVVSGAGLAVKWLLSPICILLLAAIIFLLWLLGRVMRRE